MEDIREIATESWLDTYSEIISEKAILEVVEDWYSPEDLRDQVKDPIFFIAESEGVPVGFIHASTDEEPAHLHRLYLRPEEQGKGIGTELYQRAKKELVDRDFDLIELEVLSENEKANGFYRDKGFEEQEEEEIELKGENTSQKVLLKEL